MRNEFTAVIEQQEGGFIAYSPEMPGANGQGRTKQEELWSLKEAIALILDVGVRTDCEAFRKARCARRSFWNETERPSEAPPCASRGQ
jgi:predicted RNase H-like HicB family nuclease